MSIGKNVQRRIYDVLLDRTTFLTLVLVVGVVVVSGFQFGHSWLEWSTDKYSALVNSFSDNLAGRSMRSRLCQYVPIDAVYTWVNGSDPVFLDDLKHAKERRIHSKKHIPLRGCPFGACVPSHLAVLDRVMHGETRLSLIKEQNPHLQEAMTVFEPSLVCGSHVENRSALVFEDGGKCEAAVNASCRLNLGLDAYNMSLAYWTTEWTVPNSFPMPSYFMLLDIPKTATEQKIIHALPEFISGTITKIWLHKNQRLAILNSDNKTKVSEFLASHSELSFSSGVIVHATPANLIIEMPKYADDETYQPKRFADYDQLRYSLRSVEKFSPWVRRVFLVTNGQIPHWINIDHPKLTIVTHEEIFEDTNNLPTFSSPAIEANLYRIPGLSKRFLYFNDDVLLGKEVWPEDFYTYHEGFKVRWAWPLPECNKNCPSSWIHDGYCDVSCNTTACMYDGGDCIGENPKMGFGDQDEDHAFHWQDSYEDRALCNFGCLDNWLADKFCDESCNVAECAYDAGDCGVHKFKYLHEEPAFQNPSTWPNQFNLPPGVTVAFWNVSLVFRDFDEVGLVPVEHRAVRSLSLSDDHKVMTILLHVNVTASNISVVLQGKNNGSIIIHDFTIVCDTFGHVTVDEPIEEDIDNRKEETEPQIITDMKLPEQIEQILGENQANNLTRHINETLFNLTENDAAYLKILKKQLDNEELTEKGFLIKKKQLLIPYELKYFGSQENISDVNIKSQTSSLKGGRALLWAAENVDENSSARVVRAGQRRLLDAYGDSLLYVHRLYSADYGYSQRSVPAHIPHFVDLDVLAALRAKYFNEWQKTSGHVFRQGDDMQFSFSYAHFMLNEKKDFAIEEIFHEFDTDISGTWSDREIRTLLTRIHSLPLYLESINAFEDKILRCAEDLSGSLANVETPLYERYYDSKLPVVTRELILKCPAIVDMLEGHFRNRQRYRHKIVDDSESAFKKLTSNMSHVVHELDDLRKNPVKFVCINDDTDPTRPADNKNVHAFLVDFFESILPVPSSFELPKEYRNKYLHVSELSRWTFYRSLLRWAALVSFIGLLISVVFAYFGIELNELCSKVCRVLLVPFAPKSRPKNYTV